eukprot:scaffold368281_cov30-Prasinocladus_malaysianus.AAC.1
MESDTTFAPLNYVVPRQQKAMAAVKTIRETTEELIAKCKRMVSRYTSAQLCLRYYHNSRRVAIIITAVILVL